MLTPFLISEVSIFQGESDDMYTGVLPFKRVPLYWFSDSQSLTTSHMPSSATEWASSTILTQAYN